MLEWLRNWKEEYEQKKLFREMWESEHSCSKYGDCYNVHRDVAYKLFQLESRIADLEEQLSKKEPDDINS